MSSRAGFTAVLVVAGLAAWGGERYGLYQFPWDGGKSRGSPTDPSKPGGREGRGPDGSAQPAAPHPRTIFDVGVSPHSPATPNDLRQPTPRNSPNLPDSPASSEIIARLHDDVAKLDAARQEALRRGGQDAGLRQALAAKEAAAERMRTALDSADPQDRDAAARDLAAKTQAVADLRRSAYAADPAVVAAQARVDDDQRALDRILSQDFRPPAKR